MAHIGHAELDAAQSHLPKEWYQSQWVAPPTPINHPEYPPCVSYPPTSQFVLSSLLLHSSQCHRTYFQVPLHIRHDFTSRSVTVFAHVGTITSHTIKGSWIWCSILRQGLSSCSFSYSTLLFLFNYIIINTIRCLTCILLGEYIYRKD